MMKPLLKIIYVLLFSTPVLLFAQNVGIGTLTPTQAKLQIQGGVGNNMLVARVSATSSGITLGNVGSQYPTVGFNAEFSSGYKRMSNGWAGFFQFDALNGDNKYWLSTDSLAANTAFFGYRQPFTLQGSGNVRINNYLGVNADGNVDSGRVIIAHNSSIASPTLKLLETSNTDYSRFELSNTGTNRFWHIAGFNSTTGASADRLNIYHSTAGDIMSFNGSGQVAIGSPIKFTVDNSYKLSINGKVICTEMKVQLASGWPDYVFGKKYQLRSLPELEAYIAENQHLPNIPSASEIKDGGLSIGDMQKRLMEKVEELTLYIIKQDKQIGEQNKRIQLLEKKRK